MEISSKLNLCLLLISAAIQRCRQSQNLCRLSVALKRSSPSSVIISISDTGVECCVEAFKDLNCGHDGMLCVATTGICDNEIHSYRINLKEVVSARRVAVLPLQPKHGAKFSGTEVSFSTIKDVSGLLPEIACFLKKMLILGIPVFSVQLQNESIEVMVQHNTGPRVFVDGCNIEQLKSGFEDYVLKHGNKTDTKCSSCFPDHCIDPLKVGTGVAHSTTSQNSAGMIVEAVVIISEPLHPSGPCSREFGTNTEVLLLKDFSPFLLTETSMNVLTSFDWKSYGLTMANVLDLDGHALLEWENLPPPSHIDIALHCYQPLTGMPPARKTNPADHRKLLKKALKYALDNMKEKYAGLLLSANAVKVCSYVPDLATTIAGLIMSSENSDFQGECMKLLNLQHQHQTDAKHCIEECLREKILKAIGLNDKRSRQGKVPAPLLFEDEGFHEPDFPEEEEFA